MFILPINRYKNLALSFPLRSFFGKHPLLFYALYGLIPKNRMLSVNKNTQLVIEGFPRSANTFAVVAFSKAQPTKLRIAHHMHVPAQIIKGVQRKIPTIVLIRNPKDAIVSLVMYDPRISLAQALKCYISFYQTIYLYRAKYVVARFEEVINDYSNVIEKTNDKFGTNFITPAPNNLESNHFNNIETIGKIEAKRQGKTEYSELNVARPSSLRASLKKELMQKLEQTENQKDLMVAEKIYHEFVLS